MANQVVIPPFANSRLTRIINLSARRSKRRMQRGQMTFGSTEAIVLAIAGIGIAVAMVASQLASGPPLD